MRRTPGPRRWKAVGGDRVTQCTFCGGGPTEAVVGCPDGDAPILWQVAVCRECLTDLIMTRFAAVKHQRTVALAKDMNAAADEIVKLRNQARRDKPTPPNCAPKNRTSEKSSGFWKTRNCTTSPEAAARCYSPHRAPLIERSARSQGCSSYFSRGTRACSLSALSCGLRV
jgi:hypothetical protein